MESAMRWIAVLLISLLASPLWCETEVERLQREATVLRQQISELRALKLSPNPASTESEEPLTRLKQHAFSWSTSDGKFALNMVTTIQFVYTYHDVRANSGKGPGADNGRDFHNARLPYVRIEWSGHLFFPDLAYRFELAPVNDEGRFGIEELYFRWRPAQIFNVTLGQQRSFFSYEQGVDRSRRVFTKRSAADAASDQGFVKGLTIAGGLDLWAPRVLQWRTGVFNGVMTSSPAQGGGGLEVAGNHSEGVRVTNPDATENLKNGFRNSDSDLLADSFSDSVDADLMTMARFEFHLLGDMEAANASQNSDLKFMFGVAASYLNSRVDGGGTFLGNSYHGQKRSAGATGPVPASGRKPVRAEILAVTFDGHMRGFGFFVNWSLFYREVEFHNHGSLEGSNSIGRYTVAATQDTAATIEIGYYVTPLKTVIALRASAVNNDEFGSQTAGGQPVDGDAFGPDTNEYGSAFSWLIHGDSLKLTFDYRYVVQQMPHGTARGKDAFAGVERVSEHRNFHEFRLQLQWIF